MSESSQEARSTQRWVRVDLIVAIGALIVSLAAMLGTWYQSRIVADQLTTSVWPYLSFVNNYNDSDYSLELQNDGTGPAIIRGVRTRVDGEPMSDEAAMIHKLLRPLSEKRPQGRTRRSSLSYGQVLRAGQALPVLGLHDAKLALNLATHPKRIAMDVCYCSILGRCWIVKTGGDEPADTRDCSAFGRKGLDNGLFL